MLSKDVVTPPQPAQLTKQCEHSKVELVGGGILQEGKQLELVET